MAGFQELGTQTGTVASSDGRSVRDYHRPKNNDISDRHFQLLVRRFSPTHFLRSTKTKSTDRRRSRQAGALLPCNCLASIDRPSVSLRVLTQRTGRHSRFTRRSSPFAHPRIVFFPNNGNSNPSQCHCLDGLHHGSLDDDGGTSHTTGTN